MNDFETAVAEAHDALVAAGHGWAQPRRLTEVAKLEAARLPAEWISAPKPVIEQRTVRIRRIDHLAIRFAPLAMMRLQGAIFDPNNRQLFSAEAGLQASSDCA
ncbi:hypothetical protein [Acidovorax sp. SUPP3334]|uniref:hypothetical protein n=1 Tax=Acidovorax sp. SUPP3334 TaxID=2920881 RepID=UPI0023DE4252|nr:hypothetical protein [Acidovorax sp. SUPP3334]GKT26038.1 hypothetical protein AVHM3334_19865 [Acidovorax sp. SUPP3334]